MSLSQPRAPHSTSRPPSGELASGGGGVISQGLPQPHGERRGSEDTQVQISIH